MIIDIIDNNNLQLNQPLQSGPDSDLFIKEFLKQEELFQSLELESKQHSKQDPIAYENDILEVDPIEVNELPAPVFGLEQAIDQPIIKPSFSFEGQHIAKDVKVEPNYKISVIEHNSVELQGNDGNEVAENKAKKLRLQLEQPITEKSDEVKDVSPELVDEDALAVLPNTNIKSKKNIASQEYALAQVGTNNINTEHKILPKYEVAGHSNDAFVKQMETKILMMQNNKISAAEISVTPPELGKMEISLQVKNDHINVQIQTGSDPIRQLVEANIDRLRNNLIGGGIEFANVDVHSQDFTDKNQGEQNSNDYGFIGSLEETEISIKNSEHIVSYLV